MYPQLFKKQLTETIFWCNNQMQVSNESSQLRTLVSEPENVDDLLDRNSTSLRVFCRKICYERQQKIGHSIGNEMPEKINLKKGMLIIFVPALVMAFDGIAQSESGGFFDDNGFPAWDTWVYHVSKEDRKKYGEDTTSEHIISWVPPQFVSRVREAIPQNIDRAIKDIAKAQKLYTYLKLIDDLIEY